MTSPGNSREKRGVPVTSRRRQSLDPRRGCDREFMWRSGDPIEERFPDRLRLLLIEALEDHSDRDVAAPDQDLLAPMRIEKRLRIKFDGFGDKATIGVVRGRVNSRGYCTEKFGKLVCAQGHARDDTEPAAKDESGDPPDRNAAAAPHVTFVTSL